MALGQESKTVTVGSSLEWIVNIDTDHLNNLSWRFPNQTEWNQPTGEVDEVMGTILSFQFKHNGKNIGPELDASEPLKLTLENVQTLHIGQYSVVISYIYGLGGGKSKQETEFLFGLLEVNVPNIPISLTYVVSNDTVTITDCETSAKGDFIIPSTYEGKPITSIGDQAFKDCKNLTSVTIPDSVTSIGDEAFSSCWDLTSVTIPDSVTSIGDEAFSNCWDLTSVTIPDSITSIGVSVFSGCNSLTNVTIPDSVTSIGDGAFNDCNSLKSMMIPDSVTSIGDRAFKDCINLKSVTISNSVTSIGDEAFFRCGRLTSIIIPDRVTSIGDGAFYWCYSLTSVNIPNSVTSIGDKAFALCEGLTSVNIPNSVTSIGDEAFFRCSNLTSVTIPDEVTSIGDRAFKECINLTNIVFEGNAPSEVETDTFQYVSENAKIFIYPGATGFGETFKSLPVIIQKKLEINTFSKSAAPFSLTFETESDSTYVIEASHDLQKWGEIGEVQGTGSSVKFIERRKALFPKQYYRVRIDQ